MRTAAFLFLFSLAVLPAAHSQEPVVDPPGRVARLSHVDGEVALAPAGSEEWAEAVLNRPLTSGDRLWVDVGSRAELQMGSASVHLGQSSGFSFVDLDDDQLHMKLTEGVATVRVQRKREDESIEIDTPNATVRLLHPGEYHIEVNEDGDQTVVKTRSGESEVEGEHQSFTVAANEEGVFKGTDRLTESIEPLGPRTAFEAWANDRDRPEQESQSSRYVSRDVIGYRDLDRYGDWISEPGYGYVWRPTYVVSGWAPYRYGRWVWVSPWGWSWIDDAPWGFAPFHYGRWAYLRSSWYWVPGPIYARPVYAPALVAWTGTPGFSVSLSFGSGIGWFPLGPREAFMPAYRYSPRYIRSINVWHTTVINNTYVYNGRGRHTYLYGRDPRAVTVVDRGQFVGGRRIDGHWRRTDARDLRRWEHDARPPAIAPDRDSVLASRVVGRPPLGRVLRDRAQRDEADSRTRSVARSTPTSRVPFDVERRAIEANGGRPVSRAALMRPNQNGDALRVDREQNRSARPTRNANSARPTQTPSNSSALAGREQPSAPAAQQPSPRTDRPTWARGSDRRVVREQNDPSIRPSREQDRVPSTSRPNVVAAPGANTPNASNDNSDRARARVPSDRPSWASQQRDDSSRSNPPQLRDREPSRNGARQLTTRPEQDRSRSTTDRDRSAPSVNSLQERRPSDRSGFAMPGFQRDQRGSDRAQQQRAEPRYSAPREQPRVEQRMPQPRLAPQPRIEQPQRAAPPPRIAQPSRAEPPRSQTPRAQPNVQRPAARPQNNEPRSGQQRSFGRQQSRQP
ncbi:MAG TPA: DUF6600 domain-containing protein [Povalibacter sp.]|nr:DUF6600 domain-containing protein [Povalibacter sp.]